MELNIKKSGTALTVNMSALVDIAFQLIIFFVIVARFDSPNKELPMSLAKASAAAPLSFKPSEVVISVTKEGQMAVSADKSGTIIDGTTLVNEEELLAVLNQVSANNPGRTPVKIRADEACKFQHAATVLNALKLANITDYAFQTDGGQ